MSKGTPMRHVRVDDALWTEALRTAKANGEHLSEIIRAALADYVEKGTK